MSFLLSMMLYTPTRTCRPSPKTCPPPHVSAWRPKCRHNAPPAVLSCLARATLNFCAQNVAIFGHAWAGFPYIWVPGLTQRARGGTRSYLSRHDEKTRGGRENATIRGNVWLRIEHRAESSTGNRSYSIGSCQGVRETLCRESGRETRRDYAIVRNAGLAHRPMTRLGAKSEFRILDDGDDTGREEKKDWSATTALALRCKLTELPARQTCQSACPRSIPSCSTTDVQHCPDR